MKPIVAFCLCLCLSATTSHAAERDVRNEVAMGALAFAEICQRCHKADGYGEEGLYPSLHRAALMADRERLVRTILDGRKRHLASGDGKDEQALMPALAFLSDREIVSIIAFITNSWGNDVLLIPESEVAAIRRQLNPPRVRAEP